MSELKSPQPQTQPQSQQQQPQGAPQQSQSMDGQVQVQVQLAHDGSQQMHAQAQQVPSSGTSGMIPTSTMVMSAAPQQTLQQQQIMQNMQSPPALAPLPSHSGSTTITTMSTLGQQQQMTDWASHGRVQVIQQPLQNPTAYVQQVYNPQGQLLMPGNIALHPAGMNQGPIQVIATGKAFQPGQMPHMLTTAQGKQLVQGQATSFPGYATIPTSGNNQQTLVISQLGVQHILPQQQQQQSQQQKQDMSKYTCNTTQQPQRAGAGGVSNQQTAQGAAAAQAAAQAAAAQAAAAMQFAAPWQATFGPATSATTTTGLPQGLAWATPAGTLQSPTAALLTAQGNQIFIRGGSQPDPTGMFIHNAAAAAAAAAAAQQALPTHTAMGGQQMAKPQQMEMQQSGQQQQQQQQTQKAVIPKTFSNILPNSVGPQLIRPASSVSTQTGQTQTHVHQANLQAHKSGTKVRTKTVLSRTTPSMATQKSDAANQTKGTTGQTLQPKLNGSGQQTMLVATQHEKIMRAAIAQQQQQQQQQQFVAVHQQQQQQQQHLQQQIFQQQIQPKPGTMLMSGTIPGHLVTSDRSVVPMVSMQPGVGQSIMSGMMVQTVDQVQAFSQGVQMLAPPISMKVVEEATIGNGKLDATEENSVGPGRPDEASSDSGSANVTIVNPPSVAIDTQPLIATISSTTSPATTTTSISSSSTTLSTVSSATAADNGSDKENVEKSSGPPKAMVKPQVLTHVIEGFVIQESSEPFAVNRGAHHEIFDKNSAVATTGATNQFPYEPPKKKQAVQESGTTEKQWAKCEMCGKVDLKSKFKQSKRFCSLPCAKRYNVGCSARVGLFADDDKNSEDDGVKDSSESGTSSPLNANAPTTAEDDTPKVNPIKWTVSEVCDFIRQLPGCAEYVDDFAIQEIDGQALMLLKEDHLMSAMSIKLGPALKIVSKIDSLRGNSESATPAATNSGSPATAPSPATGTPLK